MPPTITMDRMTWLNEPDWGPAAGGFWVRTKPETDCWQRTHYGFRRDNAHALLRPAGDSFRVSGRFRFEPNAQYDQCGLLIRADENCWFKCSVEFEPGSESRLGSVMTNHGYSDWATQDISPSIQEMSYEIEVDRRGLVARYSADGRHFRQMRVAQLLTDLPLMAGIYGCSPTGQGFRFEVLDLNFEG